MGADHLPQQFPHPNFPHQISSLLPPLAAGTQLLVARPCKPCWDQWMARSFFGFTEACTPSTPLTLLKVGASLFPSAAHQKQHAPCRRQRLNSWPRAAPTLSFSSARSFQGLKKPHSPTPTPYPLRRWAKPGSEGTEPSLSHKSVARLGPALRSGLSP